MLRNLRQVTFRALAGATATLALIAGLACRQSAPVIAAQNTVLGVGGSFPAPLYTRWAQDYHARSPVVVHYQGIGSVGGIQQSMAKTVDFGASDEPLTSDQLAQSGLFQFPSVVGGVTPIVNLPGVGAGQMKLTGALLGDIFLGRVTRWNDPRIVALNPGLKLPDAPIAVIHRLYPSGTTFLFTSYLSLVSPAWSAKVGAGDAVSWPVGVAGWGNGGIVGAVQQTAGAIGYVEYTYAKAGNLAVVQLQDHDGAFVAPTAQGFAAAAADANWGKSAGNDVQLLDQPGAGSWPITGATYILVYRRSPKPEKTRQVLAFFDWAYRNGDATAAALDYAPLPLAAKNLVRRQWSANVKDGFGQPLYAPAS